MHITPFYLPLKQNGEEYEAYCYFYYTGKPGVALGPGDLAKGTPLISGRARPAGYIFLLQALYSFWP